MEIFGNYPYLSKSFEMLCQTRRNEILTHMVETDCEYEKLCNKRANASMTLKEALENTHADVLFEEYSNAVYAQEVYELDAVYKQALNDALSVLREQNIL